ncbi:MAG: MATE family efflux transporter [Proteobacteria bacterium]|nr:MATE family efflux transporter [Pseudomonadota bacterium]
MEAKGNKEMNADGQEDLSVRKASMKEVIFLAMPIIISMISMSVLGLIDTFFMGLIGPEAQAAVGFGAPSTFSVLSLFFGMFSGLTTFVSQYFGAKRYSECGVMLWHVLYLALGFGVLSAIFLNPFLWWLLNVMQVNPDFLQETFDYMKVRMFAAPWVFVSYTLLSFLRGIGDMKTPAYVSLIAIIANVPLTYIFAFGFGPVPAYGVAGAAIGTVISQGIEAMLYAWAVFGAKNNRMFATRGIIRPKWSIYKEFVRVALPVGGSWAIEHWGWIIYGLYISSLTKVEAAANAIIQSFMNLAFMPGLAISIAATTLVGQYMGAKNIKSAEKSANYALVLSVISLFSLGFAMFLLRYVIAEGFSSDAEVIEVTANLFLFAFVYQIFDAAGVTTSGALRGAGDTRFPMLVSLGGIWGVMVPLIFVQDKLFGWGVYGAWGVSSLCIILCGCMYYVRFKRGKWKTMGVV